MSCEPERPGRGSGAPTIRYVCKWHPMAWFLRAMHAGGCAIPGRIYILAEYKHDRGLLRHELAHIRQMQREGQLRYWVKYYWWMLTKGYAANPYEIEAEIARHAPSSLLARLQGGQHAS